MLDDTWKCPQCAKMEVKLDEALDENKKWAKACTILYDEYKLLDKKLRDLEIECNALAALHKWGKA